MQPFRIQYRMRVNAPREKKKPRVASSGRAIGSSYLECWLLRCVRFIATIAALIAIEPCWSSSPLLVHIAAVADCYSTAAPIIGAHWERPALNRENHTTRHGDVR